MEKRRRAAAVQDAGAKDGRPANAERLGLRQSSGALGGENAMDRISCQKFRMDSPERAA